MAIEGNSFRERETEPKDQQEKAERKMEPVADGSIEKKKPGYFEKWLKKDSGTIKDFLMETILIPGILDGIAGIGDIIIDSLTSGISQLFEKRGFLSDIRSKSGSTRYSDISKKRRRRSSDDDDDDDYDNDELTYDNVRVESELKAKRVIAELRDLIADPEYRYCTVANLYELTNNADVVTSEDHNHGWTKLDSATYVRTKNRKKPWLLRLPRPKDIRNIKY